MSDWLKEALEIVRRLPPKAKAIRERAKEDLNFFATLINPGYMYGEIHRDIYRWMQDYTLFGRGETLSSNKLIMLPRAHLKSHMVATWCAWIITRHPEVTILYLSATAELAETQLYAIQNILSSEIYTQFFPEYINPQEGLRERWSQRKISIDHPDRGPDIRDPTIATAGLTTNTTGWHADIIVADDLVIPENAYTEDGRESVVKKASQFTSIRNPGGFTIACGTRYFPTDIYDTWKNQTYPLYDDEGEQIDTVPVWEVKEYKVEENGIFIWPRVIRAKDGKAFGFNRQVLARIKAEYGDRVQFYAQYYNDPNDPESNRIDFSKFQYYDQRKLKKEGGRWFFAGKRLNIYAAVDFAFSLTKAADYTAIVVVGVDAEGFYYILDIDRFKSNKTLEYFQHIADLHSRWKFNKIRAEVTVAQAVIVEAIKDYVKQHGLSISVDEYRPSKAEGSKEERIAAALEHLYDDMKVWHFEGGWTKALEEELILARPAHDDIKDALASAVSIAVKPFASKGQSVSDFFHTGLKANSRFGGVSFK